MSQGSAAVTIGNFDGVHLGHRALVARARAAVGDGRVIALAFDPHPATVLRPEAAPARLTTFEQRRSLLIEAGADEVIRLDPTPDLLALDPEPFLRRVVADHKPGVIVEGTDFCFGRARAGSIESLKGLGPALGFRAEVVEPVEVALTDQLLVTASSTIARWLIGLGRIRDAAAVLGRPYTISGVVRRGDRRGRQLGFPTANLETPLLLPADGVYAGRARLPDGRSFTAAASVGTRPTFNGLGRRLEVYLLDAPSEPSGAIHGLEEYGWTIEVELHAWVRDDLRFESVAGLVEQMRRDRDAAARIMGSDAPFPAAGRKPS